MLFNIVTQSIQNHNLTRNDKHRQYMHMSVVMAS
eukprot:UN08045